MQKPNSLDELVIQLERENRNKVSFLQLIETAIFITNICVLSLFAFLVVNPVINRVKAQQEKITKQIKQNEEALVESRLLKHALSQAVEGIAIADCDGTVLWINPAYSQLAGCSFEQLKNNKIHYLGINHANKDKVSQLWHSLRQGKGWIGVFSSTALSS